MFNSSISYDLIHSGVREHSDGKDAAALHAVLANRVMREAGWGIIPHKECPMPSLQKQNTLEIVPISRVSW